MKAIVFEEHGGVEKLKALEMPDPAPGPGEAVVKVSACALNHLDIWVREGLPGKPSIPMPHIGGCDVSGWIESLGPGSDPSLKVGSPVLAAPGLSCGECPCCLRGQDNLCPKFNVLGFQRQGGLAEKVLVPTRNLLPLPSSSRYPLQDWAAFPLVFTTAWSMLVDKAKLQKGETVLIQAAGSGVGSAAIQLAKSLGARVITTVGQEWKAEAALKLGADEVIDYKKEDFEKRTKELTGGKGVEVVFEHIGPTVFAASLRCLAPGGRLVTCGSTSGPDIALNLRAVFARNLSILGNYMGPVRGLRECVGLAEEGKLHPVVGRTFSLSQAREAQECMLARDFFGKIVLKID